MRGGHIARRLHKLELLRTLSHRCNPVVASHTSMILCSRRAMTTASRALRHADYLPARCFELSKSFSYFVR